VPDGEIEMSAGRSRDGSADRAGFGADIVALFFVSVYTENDNERSAQRRSNQTKGQMGKERNFLAIGNLGLERARVSLFERAGVRWREMTPSAKAIIALLILHRIDEYS
jgi:hypothetical protein